MPTPGKLMLGKIPIFPFPIGLVGLIFSPDSLTGGRSMGCVKKNRTNAGSLPEHAYWQPEVTLAREHTRQCP